MSLFSTHHVNRSGPQLVGLVALVAALYVAAGIGMAYVAGFGAVHQRLEHAHWWWLAVTFGAAALSFCGYYFAYGGVKWVEDGPELDKPALLAVVAAAFSGFLARGATALDELAMRAGGASNREAKVRIGGLAAFEHGTLAMIVCPAAIVAIAAGVTIPRPGFTWPWAIVPPPAFVFVIWLAERYRDRLRDRGGWRRPVGMFFDTAHIVYALLKSPRRHWLALAGMAVYWGGDMLALWAATAAFGVQMSALSVIVALGTAMLFTRRTAPVAGSGLMTLSLVPTLWYGAAVPFAAATMGVVAYRFFTLWAPLPASLAALPKLRELGHVSEHVRRRPTRVETREPALGQ